MLTIFNSIGHLTKTDFELALQNIYANLNPGGLYIFDIFNLDYLLHGDNITKLTIDWQKKTGDVTAREIQYSTISQDGILASYDIYHEQKGIKDPKISTAIPNIYAKPVIDILLVVHDLSKIDVLNPSFEALGYECLGEFGIAGRRFYLKNKTKRTHHVHLFEKGHPDIQRHLAFRDYLRTHPHEAQAYSWIKRCLAEQFPTDRTAYVNAKDSFIRAIDYRAGVDRFVPKHYGDNDFLATHYVYFL